MPTPGDISPQHAAATTLNAADAAAFPEAHHVSRIQIIASVAAITATYVYFLIFAEFAFLRFAAQLVAAERMTALMGALGVAGIAGSFVAGAVHTVTRAKRFLSLGFIASGISAGITLLAASELSALLASVTTGFSLGWTTVMLALCLRPTLHRTRLGLCCGTGTGLAYAICNLPMVFLATPNQQTMLACAAAVVGLISSFWMRGEPLRPSGALDSKRLPFVLWVCVFGALVFLDSLLFYIIHQTPALQQGQWDEASFLIGNAFVHLCAAMLAGVALDRNKHALAILAALLLLVISSWLITSGSQSFPAARMIYVTGVSIYSTTLVWFAARSGHRWHAAILFAIAGWLGSALAIGIAMHDKSPNLIIFVSIAVMLVGVGALFARYMVTERLRR